MFQLFVISLIVGILGNVIADMINTRYRVVTI
jgi:hypothetical protein